MKQLLNAWKLVILFSFPLLCLTACKTSAPAGVATLQKEPSKAATNAPVVPEEEENFLGDWKLVDFAGHGEVKLKDGQLLINMGADLSGAAWKNTNNLPKTNYEVELDAMKVDGNDFFCGLTFPVNDSFCSLIVGGWGGGVTGLSSLDFMDASENETSKNLYYERNHWYHIRLRVLPGKIQAWVDADKVIDVSITGRKVSLRGGSIELCKPLGVSTYQTTSLIKNFKVKNLTVADTQ